MSIALNALEIVLGILLVAAVLYDIFCTVVLPHPTRTALRISPYFVRDAWRLLRKIGLRRHIPKHREYLFAPYAPFSLLLLLGVWVIGLVLGYGLILFALRSQIQPHTISPGEAFYLSGVALFTLGFGDIVAVGTATRIIVLIEAASGLALMGAYISLLFALYTTFWQREAAVVLLTSRTGAPPSGVALLDTYARLNMLPELHQFFMLWEQWTADVLQTHLAYPILAYFRSIHHNMSWIGAIGALLDAANLVLTTVEDLPRGPAELLYNSGCYLVLDLSHYFHITHEDKAHVRREEFDILRTRLSSAGFSLTDADTAWTLFSERRATYAGVLDKLAAYWAVPSMELLGDRATSHYFTGQFHDRR